MSLYQFHAALDGVIKANGGEEKLQAPTPDEFDDMLMRLG